MRILFYGAVTLVTVISALSYGDYQLIPKYQTRQTMARSTAYHEGSIRELYLLKRRYEWRMLLVKQLFVKLLFVQPLCMNLKSFQKMDYQLIYVLG